MDDFNDIKFDSPEEPVPEISPKPKPLGLFGMMFNKMTSDMKFVGMFTIIYGVLSCLSIIGAIVGIPLIFAGLRLREAADEYNLFQSISDNNALKRAFEKQGRYFNILKIMIIVGIIITILYIIFFIYWGFMIFNSFSSYQNFN